jgi:apolipoprotein N-acyltransferase
MPGLIARFTGWSWPLALVAACLLAVAHGAGWSLWAYVVRRIGTRLPMLIVAPAAFVAMECWFPSFFPWSLGLAHYRFLNLVQVAELGGPCVLSFLEILAAGILVQAWHSRRQIGITPWRGPAVLVALLMACVAGGWLRRSSIDSERSAAPMLRIATLQAGTALLGWQARVPPNLLERYRTATHAIESTSGPFDLVVWPEKVSPILRNDAAHDYPPGNPRRIGDELASPLLFGAESMDLTSRNRWNSAALLLPDHSLRVVYSKVKLIPWSEWLPSWAERLFGRRYRSGELAMPVILTPPASSVQSALPIGVFICFESAFPGHVRELVAHGAEILVNISDDSWFGLSAEPEQHLAHAVFRAIESRRDLIRAAGSGISAFITATGKVQSSLPVFHSGQAPAALVAEPRRLQIRGANLGLGQSFPFACAAVVLVSALMAWRRARFVQDRTVPAVWSIDSVSNRKR